MIEIFEGRLGGGKSYSAVKRMVKAWLKGRHVYHNLPICWEPCEVEGHKKRGVAQLVRERFKVEINPGLNHQLKTDDEIRSFHEHVSEGSLVVLDEIHEQFNARDYAHANRKLLSFLTHSRHYGVDIIFISQSMLNVDKQFARLVQYIWRFRDLSTYRVPGLGCKWPTQHLVATQYDYDGRTVLKRDWQKRDTGIFECYDSKVRLNHLSVKEALAPLLPEKVKQEKPKVNKLLVMVAVVALGACGWAFMAKRGAAAAQPLSVAADLRRLGADRVLVASGVEIYAVVISQWDSRSAWVDGEELQIGEWSPYGVVRKIDSAGVQLEREGHIVLLRGRALSQQEMENRFPGLPGGKKGEKKEGQPSGVPPASAGGTRS